MYIYNTRAGRSSTHGNKGWTQGLSMHIKEEGTDWPAGDEDGHHPRASGRARDGESERWRDGDGDGDRKKKKEELFYFDKG